MSLQFSYENKPVINYGNIPTIKLSLFIESPILGLVPLTFLFDTGADITSLPASIAKQLGINLVNCPKELMTGYEGKGIKVYHSNIKIKFGRKSFFIPCVFNPNKTVPIVLGRAGILSRFNILLDGKHRKAIFEEINSENLV